MTTTPLLSTLCMLLAAAIILSVAHSKDIASLAADHASDLKVHISGDGHAKLDLHNHIDKANLKPLLKTSDNPQADYRSLRLWRDYTTIGKHIPKHVATWFWRLGQLIGLTN